VTLPVRWLRRSLRDLQTIHDFIASENPAAARQTVRRIRSAVATLADFPERGRPGRVAGTRELFVSGTPFFVAYRLKADTVEILRVLHGARRYPDT